MVVKKKKKTGTAAKYGPRYGGTLRKKVSLIEKKQKAWHKCPYCNKERVKRISAGVWHCKACETKFTGKAYAPK